MEKKLSKHATNASFEVKGTAQTVLTLNLFTQSNQIQKELMDHFAQAPKLFNMQPMILNISEVSTMINAQVLLDIQAACEASKINIIGVSGCHSIVAQEAIKASGLKQINPRNAPEAPSIPEKKLPVQSPDNDTIRSHHVRSGQQIETRGSLVIIGNVSRGAEIVADGSIHVYGTLLGRAIAGANGDKSAKIFAQSLDPELLCIAGVYVTSDEISVNRDRACYAELTDQEICCTELA